MDYVLFRCHKQLVFKFFATLRMTNTTKAPDTHISRADMNKNMTIHANIPSSIRTIPSVPEFHRFSPSQRESRTLTAGREFHPALKRYVSGAKIAIIFTIAMLFLLLVSHYGNHIHHDGKHSQHYIVEGQILKLAALETDCP